MARNTETSLQHIIRKTARRDLAQRTLRLAGRGLALGLAAGLVLLLVDRVFAWHVPIRIFSIIAATGLFAGIVAAFISRTDRLAIAVLLDRSQNLKDRIGTAEVIARGGLVHDEEFAALALRDADRIADRVDVKAAAPVHLTRIWGVCAGVAAMLALGIWLLPAAAWSGARNQPLQADAMATVDVQQQAADAARSIDSALASLPRNDTQDAAVREELDALDRLSQQLASPQSTRDEIESARDESAARLDELAQRLAEQSQRDLAAADEIAKRFAGATADDNNKPKPPMTAQQFSEALERGDFGEAAKQLDSLLNDQSLTPADRHAAAQHLRDLAKELEDKNTGDPEDTERREQLAQALRDHGVDENVVRELLDNPPKTTEELQQRLREQNIDPDVAHEMAQDVDQLKRDQKINEQADQAAREVKDALDRAVDEVEQPQQQQPQEEPQTAPEQDSPQSKPQQNQKQQEQQQQGNQSSNRDQQDNAEKQESQQAGEQQSRQNERNQGQSETKSQSQSQPDQQQSSQEQGGSKPREQQQSKSSETQRDQNPQSGKQETPRENQPSTQPSNPDQATPTTQPDPRNQPQQQQDRQQQSQKQQQSSKQDSPSQSQPDSQTRESQSAQSQQQQQQSKDAQGTPQPKPAKQTQSPSTRPNQGQEQRGNEQATDQQRGDQQQQSRQQQNQPQQQQPAQQQNSQQQDSQQSPGESPTDSPAESPGEQQQPSPSQSPAEVVRRLAQQRQQAQQNQETSERMRQAAREMADKMTPEQRRQWAEQWAKESGDRQEQPNENDDGSQRTSGQNLPMNPEANPDANPESQGGVDQETAPRPPNSDRSRGRIDDATTDPATNPGNQTNAPPDSNPRLSKPNRLEKDDPERLDLRGQENADELIAQWLDPNAKQGDPGRTTQANAPQRVRSAQDVAERAVNDSAVQKRYHKAIKRYFGKLNETLQKASGETVQPPSTPLPPPAPPPTSPPSTPPPPPATAP